jgi:hypothetical protein
MKRKALKQNQKRRIEFGAGKKDDRLPNDEWSVATEVK